MKRLVSNITEEEILKTLLKRKGKIVNIVENKEECAKFSRVFNNATALSDELVNISEEIVEEKLDYLRKEKLFDRDYTRTNCVVEENVNSKVYLEEYDGKKNKDWAREVNRRYQNSVRASRQEMLNIKDGKKTSGKGKK